WPPVSMRVRSRPVLLFERLRPGSRMSCRDAGRPSAALHSVVNPADPSTTRWRLSADHYLSPQKRGSSRRFARLPRRRGHRVSNCVVGSGGSRLPCSTIAEHSVEGCDHFSHDGHDDDLGFFVGGDEAIVKGFEGGTVTACTEGGHVKHVTDRHPTTIDAAVSL